LADRPDDILPLAEHFLALYAAREGKKGMKFGDDARAALVNHEFSGNVRELQNRVQRAVLVEVSGVVTAGDLGLPLGGTSSRGDSARRMIPGVSVGPLSSANGGGAPPAPASASGSG